MNNQLSQLTQEIEKLRKENEELRVIPVLSRFFSLISLA